MSDEGLIIFGIGMLAGGFVVYVIQNNKNQQPAVLSQQPQYLMTPSYNEYETLRDRIDYLNTELQRVRQENNDLKTQLKITTSQGKEIKSGGMPQAKIKEELAVQKGNIHAVQNEETWEIKKDKRGRLEGVTVHRKVTPVG
ncbi:MAG: hypothetical protein PHZ02_01615 [Desulfocapsaceae bacterium]|nr:hypothetical protein [Desulfocapsaceae bacterium]